MDESTIELFAHLDDALTTLAELQIIEMLASDKYTIDVKAFLVQMLIGLNHGALPMDLSCITGKDETELLEWLMSNNGGNGGGSGPENPNTPT